MLNNIHQDYLHPTGLETNTGAWRMFVRLSFALSLGAASIGILFAPVEIWVKAYLGMGLYFVVASTLMLSKTIRDEHEAKRLHNRISNAKAERLITEHAKEDV